MADNEKQFGLWGIKLFGDTTGLKVDLGKAMGMTTSAGSKLSSSLTSIARTIGSNMAGAFRTMGNAASAAFRGVGRILFNVKTALAGLLGAGGFLALIKLSANAADEIAKMSQRVAISVETLSGYRLAADLAGTSLADMGTALQIASRNILDASRGTGDAKNAFDELGISVFGAGGKLKSAEQIMLEVADRFSQMDDGARKTALAMDIFGRSGAQMIPLLNQGRTELEAQRKEAELFGATFTASQAKISEAFNDNLTRIFSGLSGFRNLVVGNCSRSSTRSSRPSSRRCTRSRRTGSSASGPSRRRRTSSAASCGPQRPWPASPAPSRWWWTASGSSWPGSGASRLCSRGQSPASWP